MSAPGHIDATIAQCSNTYLFEHLASCDSLDSEALNHKPPLRQLAVHGAGKLRRSRNGGLAWLALVAGQQRSGVEAGGLQVAEPGEIDKGCGSWLPLFMAAAFCLGDGSLTPGCDSGLKDGQ